ncbi:MAG: PAS domain-containing protein [Methanomicrobiales archaeon]|nr:PAS domain-containing protein [Methanomicrobiales archaeon]
MNSDPVLPGQDWTSYDMLPVGIIIISSEYQVLSWNDCIADWTGIRPAEIIGTSLLSRFSNLNQRLYLARIEQVFSGGPAVFFSSQFHPHLLPAPLPNSELRILSTTVVPVRSGTTFHAMMVIMDVTDLTRQVHAFREMKNIAQNELAERKRAEDALVLANRKLNLLSSVTRHDILNQVMVLRSFLELVRDCKIDGEAQEFLGKADQAADAITHQIEFTRSYQDIGVKSPVWQDVQAIISSNAKILLQRKIQVEISLPHILVYADPLLQRVFYNLAENSLRHGKNLTLFRAWGEETPDGFCIFCEDDGGGVDAENKEKIFRREYFQHTGFGLYLSRDILSITGITIRENGVSGKGARFEILIPPGMYRLYP